MASIFDSIKGLVTPDLIKSAASTLGEDGSNVTKAITSAIPTLLGSILAKGNDSKLESVLSEAGKANDGILSGVTKLFGGTGDNMLKDLGSNLLNSILGDKLGGVASLIANVSGITSKSSNSLLSMLTPLVGGFLGKKMNTDGSGLTGLLSSLNKEKDGFLSLLPSGLGSVLGVASFANLGKNVTNVVSGISHETKRAVHTVEKAGKSGLGWLKWFLPLLIALGLIFYFWKSCGSNAKDKVINATENTVAAANQAAATAADKLRELGTFVLPDGVNISAFKGGLEEQMLKFLQSGDYKTMSADVLKDKWYNFDNINFEFGSSTQLTPESHQQIDNLAAILKHFKDVKVKIGAYTDKKGDAAVNLKISQERANTIKKILTDKGIGAQISGAEGYGDQFATVSADASDEARAVDRKMAIRFDK